MQFFWTHLNFLALNSKYQIINFKLGFKYTKKLKKLMLHAPQTHPHYKNKISFDKKLKRSQQFLTRLKKKIGFLLDHNFCTLRPKHFMKRQIQNFTEVTVMRVANKNVIKLMKVYFYPRTIASPREDSPTMRTIRNEWKCLVGFGFRDSPMKPEN